MNVKQEYLEEDKMGIEVYLLRPDIDVITGIEGSEWVDYPSEVTYFKFIFQARGKKVTNKQ